MGKKKGGKNKGDAPPVSSDQPSSSGAGPPQQQAPPQSQADFPSLGSEFSRGGGRGRGGQGGRGRGRGDGSIPPSFSRSEHSFPSLSGDTGPARPFQQPAPTQQSGYVESSHQPGEAGDGRGGGRGTRTRGWSRGRGGERGSGDTGPPRSYEQPAQGQDYRKSGHAQGEEREGGGDHGRDRGGRGRGRGGDRGRGRGHPSQQFTREAAQSPTELAQSPSSSSISSQGSGAPGRARQAPSHTPTPPPPYASGGEPSQPRQQPPPRQEMEEVKQKISKMSVSSPRSSIPLRKSKGDVVGTKGRRIPLEVNHLALSIKNHKMTAIHYDVSFKPDKPKRLYRLIMQAFQRKVYPKNFPAFDGRKNLYSNGYLPFGQVVTDTVKVRNEEKQKDEEYEVTIKFAAKVDMSPLVEYMNRGSSTNPPQEALQAIDIVLRSPAALRFVPVGRSFFTPPRDSIVDLGDGLELWYGFYQSAILGWKPFLNVDVAHKGFPKPEYLIKVIMDMTGYQERDLQQYELEPKNRDAFQKYVSGLKVEYEIPRQPQTRRTWKINKVVDSAIRQRFELETKDGRKQTLTVGEYFERQKNYRLSFPYMPCVHVGPPLKNIYVPVELCKIAPGQALMRKLNEKQTATMVRNAAQPANIRKQRIMDAIRSADFNRDKTVQEFGISVSDRFTPVNGRILDPPTLKYNARDERGVRPEKGVWRSSAFLNGKGLNNWCILNCDDRTRDDSLRKFGAELSKVGRTLGCSINPNPVIKAINKRSFQIRREDIVEKLRQCRQENHEMVAVVIPDSGDVYGKVKQAAELQVGVLTQCVKASTVFRKLNPATVTNILLKVNSKLNGVNHVIGGNKPMVLGRPIMIVGADVTHPSPDQTQIPSVAAVAASHDANAFSYNMLWRLQPPRTEIILDLENIMKAQLLFFYKKTGGYKPERIFFYRDGVSEGQFQEVLNTELQAIRRACTVLEADFKPKITFLVVQKRHHTRFFPTRREDEDGRNRNVPAGTIVDTTITHPTEFDFYLASHASIQGTSRPTKYHLLWDDNDMLEDDLEELTYFLCHLFCRCTRSVSYPAPTYYAHLAAFRARVYLEGERLKLTNLSHEQNLRQIDNRIVQDSPMFFV